ncbi:MAG: TetR/AcrR family transcriptional regulator [Burkholderiaceae bacterium]
MRRSSAEDQQRLRQQVLDASFEIFRHKGLHGLTMRAVAAAVGVSAMALYRYFADKAELVQGLWDYMMQDVHRDMSRAVAAEPTPRGRLRACTDAAMAYWEGHPDQFRLVFMTEQTTAPRRASQLADLPSYHRVIDLSLQIIDARAAELGADPSRCLLARDLRMALMVGYLHARIVNRRYPWQDPDALRTRVIDTIVDAIDDCLTSPPAARTALRVAG